MTWSEELNYRNSAQKAMSIFVGCLCFALLGFSGTQNNTRNIIHTQFSDNNYRLFV